MLFNLWSVPQPSRRHVTRWPPPRKVSPRFWLATCGASFPDPELHFFPFFPIHCLASEDSLSVVLTYATIFFFLFRFSYCCLENVPMSKDCLAFRFFYLADRVFPIFKQCYKGTVLVIDWEQSFELITNRNDFFFRKVILFRC